MLRERRRFVKRDSCSQLNGPEAYSACTVDSYAWSSNSWMSTSSLCLEDGNSCFLPDKLGNDDSASELLDIFSTDAWTFSAGWSSKSFELQLATEHWLLFSLDKSGVEEIWNPAVVALAILVSISVDPPMNFSSNWTLGKEISTTCLKRGGVPVWGLLHPPAQVLEFLFLWLPAITRFLEFLSK